MAITGRNQDRLDAAAETIRGAGGTCLPVAADVRQPDTVAALLDRVDAELGRLDLLVNGAAGNFPAPAAALSPNGFGTVVDIDLKGTFNVTRAAFPRLSGGGGAVINISATLQYLGTPLQAHAASAKAGVDALTRVLAVEWGPMGVRVNGVAPGPIDGTEGMARLAPGGLRQKMEKSVPLGRFGTVDEIAEACVYLACAEYVTGAVLVVDGGQWLAGGLGSLVQG